MGCRVSRKVFVTVPPGTRRVVSVIRIPWKKGELFVGCKVTLIYDLYLLFIIFLGPVSPLYLSLWLLILHNCGSIAWWLILFSFSVCFWQCIQLVISCGVHTSTRQTQTHWIQDLIQTFAVPCRGTSAAWTEYHRGRVGAISTTIPQRQLSPTCKGITNVNECFEKRTTQVRPGLWKRRRGRHVTAVTTTVIRQGQTVVHLSSRIFSRTLLKREVRKGVSTQGPGASDIADSLETHIWERLTICSRLVKWPALGHWFTTTIWLLKLQTCPWFMVPVPQLQTRLVFCCSFLVTSVTCFYRQNALACKFPKIERGRC